MGKYLTEADLAEIIRPASEAIPEGSYWTHVVGGGQYIVDCIAIAEGSQEPVVVYHAIGQRKTAWVRVARDFLDGRFVRSVPAEDL